MNKHERAAAARTRCLAPVWGAGSGNRRASYFRSRRGPGVGEVSAVCLRPNAPHLGTRAHRRWRRSARTYSRGCLDTASFPPGNLPRLPLHNAYFGDLELLSSLPQLWASVHQHESPCKTWGPWTCPRVCRMEVAAHLQLVTRGRVGGTRAVDVREGSRFSDSVCFLVSAGDGQPQGIITHPKHCQSLRHLLLLGKSRLWASLSPWSQDVFVFGSCEKRQS